MRDLQSMGVYFFRQVLQVIGQQAVHRGLCATELYESRSIFQSSGDKRETQPER